MSFKLFLAVMPFLEYPALLAYVYFGWRRATAVRGTHVRYAATSWMIASGMLIAIILFAKTCIYLVIQDHFAAGISFGAFLLYVWVVKGLFDDDNWFKTKWKKLKQGLKNLRRRLANASPLPSPT